MLRETSLDLIDTMPPAELIERIKTAALQVAGVRGIEKCYARRTGLQHHVDLHVEGTLAMPAHICSNRFVECLRKSALAFCSRPLTNPHPLLCHRYTTSPRAGDSVLATYRYIAFTSRVNVVPIWKTGSGRPQGPRLCRACVLMNSFIAAPFTGVSERSPISASCRRETFS